jgi:hypothetical protein
MGIFPYKEKSPRQNRESNLGPQVQYSETLTTRPRGWSYKIYKIEKLPLYEPTSDQNKKNTKLSDISVVLGMLTYMPAHCTITLH